MNRQRRRLAGETVPSRYELRLLLPDGVVRWIGISVTVVPWDGQPAILTFFSDISQRRKQLEEKLRDTLEERETILENSLVGIAFLTNEGEFRWSNQAMARMFGVSGRTAIPRNWSSLFLSQEEYLRMQKEVADCMNQDRAYQGDLQMRRLDGSLFWVTVSGKAVNTHDKTQGSVWTVMDITRAQGARNRAGPNLFGTGGHLQQRARRHQLQREPQDAVGQRQVRGDHGLLSRRPGRQVDRACSTPMTKSFERDGRETRDRS